MAKLLLHPRTAASLLQLQADPPQALLLSGGDGSGMRYIATQWLLPHTAVPRIIAAEEKSGISVQQIRELYQATRTKQSERQFFILEDAGKMSGGAQNAFLKLLEEPGKAIHFVLTTKSPEELLPTVRSRLQHVAIAPVADATLLEHLQQQYSLDLPSLQQIIFIAKGRVGLAHKLAAEPELLAQYRQAAGQAKQLITGSTFERLTALTAQTDRAQALTFLEISADMASMLLSRSSTAQEQRRLVNTLGAIHETAERLKAQGNLKIQLTRLALLL